MCACDLINTAVVVNKRSSAATGSCGRCYEVACRPDHIKDGYENKLDRTKSCKGGSIKVMITDTCPCWYPSNSWSNKRWCCNDVYHLDLSKWAYETIRPAWEMV
eukprot:gene3026-3307_t